MVKSSESSTKIQVWRIQAAEMRFLQTASGLSLRGWVRSSDIERELRVIKKNQLRWFWASDRDAILAVWVKAAG